MRLRLRCDVCRMDRLLPVECLPGERRVEEVLPKLRCAACRQPPARVALVNGRHGYAAWEVRLVGVGSLGG